MRKSQRKKWLGEKCSWVGWGNGMAWCLWEVGTALLETSTGVTVCSHMQTHLVHGQTQVITSCMDTCRSWFVWNGEDTMAIKATYVVLFRLRMKSTKTQNQRLSGKDFSNPCGPVHVCVTEREMQQRGGGSSAPYLKPWKMACVTGAAISGHRETCA